MCRKSRFRAWAAEADPRRLAELRPVRALWKPGREPHGSALTIEFMAVHRPQACGAFGAPLGEASSPAALTVLISGMSRILVMDEALGQADGDQEVRDRIGTPRPRAGSVPASRAEIIENRRA